MIIIIIMIMINLPTRNVAIRDLPFFRVGEHGTSGLSLIARVIFSLSLSLLISPFDLFWSRSPRLPHVRMRRVVQFVPFATMSRSEARRNSDADFGDFARVCREQWTSVTFHGDVHALYTATVCVCVCVSLNLYNRHIADSVSSFLLVVFL